MSIEQQKLPHSPHFSYHQESHQLSQAMATNISAYYEKKHRLNHVQALVRWQSFCHEVILETLKGNMSLALEDLGCLSTMSTQAQLDWLHKVPFVTCMDETTSNQDELPSSVNTPFVLYQGHVFMTRYWQARQKIIALLQNINQTHQQYYQNCKHTHELSNQLAPLAQQFSPSQQKILPLISQKKSGFSVILGAAGSGKSWASVQALKAISQQQPGALITMCAFTGKAVSRLSAEFQRPTTIHLQTIHQLLGINAHRHRSIYYHPENLLAYEFIMIDEASMIDLELLCTLLSAIRHDAKLIIVGDPTQLTPIGVGGGLKLIQEHFPNHVVELQEQHRYHEQSEIHRLSLLSKQGKLLNSHLQAPHTLSANEALQQKKLEHWITCYLCPCYRQKSYENLLENVVLSPWRNYQNGVIYLNRFIQQKLYQFNLLQKHQGWCEGLPIVIRNNHDAQQIYNGDRAYLQTVNHALQAIFPTQKNRHIPVHELPYFELAFAMTVHQTQGSEIDNVFLWLGTVDEKANAWLSRHLLYTSITRAKKQIQICANVVI